MSLNYYGIYIAYPPTIDLRYEGLGRQLAAFIKGASERENVCFVLVCPSWSKKMIIELFQSEGVNEDSIEICYPHGKNAIMTLHQFYMQYKKKRHKTKSVTFISKFLSTVRVVEKRNIFKLLKVRNYYSLFFYGVLLLPFIWGRILISLWLNTNILIKKVLDGIRKRFQKIFFKQISAIRQMLFNPKKNALVLEFYQHIESSEIQLMTEMINKMSHVKAWYSPTAFWPSFNQINAPKLMCVPDVVLTEFPIGFCQLGGARFLETFYKVEQAIHSGEYFVTYSEHIKNNTLMSRYGIESKNIKVIPHSVNKLDHLISTQGDNKKQKEYCQQLFADALKKATNERYSELFKNTEIKFFFYASQFRPSKNVLTLLRAYKFLLCNRFISHKLILTGRPRILKEIDSFIEEQHLQHDVLLLSGISMPELAACYKLADLAINPSLSEGGCPFTFTEALSVDTPVIMANIPVTTEIITDEKLQEAMLFDPYNWHSLVERIEWALKNRESLLTQQKALYNILKERTWTHVVNDHIDMLDHIASVAIKQSNSGNRNIGENAYLPVALTDSEHATT